MSYGRWFSPENGTRVRHSLERQRFYGRDRGGLARRSGFCGIGKWRPGGRGGGPARRSPAELAEGDPDRAAFGCPADAPRSRAVRQGRCRSGGRRSADLARRAVHGAGRRRSPDRPILESCDTHRHPSGGTDGAGKCSDRNAACPEDAATGEPGAGGDPGSAGCAARRRGTCQCRRITGSSRSAAAPGGRRFAAAACDRCSRS